MFKIGVLEDTDTDGVVTCNPIMSDVVEIPAVLLGNDPDLHEKGNDPRAKEKHTEE